MDSESVSLKQDYFDFKIFCSIPESDFLTDNSSSIETYFKNSAVGLSSSTEISFSMLILWMLNPKIIKQLEITVEVTISKALRIIKWLHPRDLLVLKSYLLSQNLKELQKSISLTFIFASVSL